jgi:hypothetical protein
MAGEAAPHPAAGEELAIIPRPDDGQPTTIDIWMFVNALADGQALNEAIDTAAIDSSLMSVGSERGTAEVVQMLEAVQLSNNGGDYWSVR